MHRIDSHRSSWIATATRRDIVRRSLRVAALVGTLLVVINQGDRLIDREMRPRDWVKIVLTYLVPFCVSTHASVSATLRRDDPAGARERAGGGRG
jgi:hypothetical protein